MITRQQIFGVLRTEPDGLTAKEIAAKLGAPNYDAGGRLSKLAAYGEIEKMKIKSPSGKTKWRLKQEEEPTDGRKYAPGAAHFSSEWFGGQGRHRSSF